MIQLHDKCLRSLKLSFCTHNIKAGKLLASRLKTQKAKSRTLFLYHPFTKNKLFILQEIAEAFAYYYGSLYNLKENQSVPQPSEMAISSFLSNLKLPALSSQLTNLNSPFTWTPHLCNGKLPGPDGFTNEYFKSFKNMLSPNLLNPFPSEMLWAPIVTLPKPGKDPDTTTYFHPISLLNSDVKLYAKILASRLSAVLPSLVKSDQMGFMQGRCQTIRGAFWRRHLAGYIGHTCI